LFRAVCSDEKMMPEQIKNFLRINWEVPAYSILLLLCVGIANFMLTIYRVDAIEKSVAADIADLANSKIKREDIDKRLVKTETRLEALEKIEHDAAIHRLDDLEVHARQAAQLEALMRANRR